ncbi:hypothetical protein FRB93_005233 [Tulasnella sp. JGI-2019a]|nr:hypothetical protein FRB93_005233 [Tulasnella sp. JGI-2019a]
MLFAFGSSPGSFYAAHGRNAYWKGLPDTLEKYLNTDRPLLHSLSVGESGAWFTKEMPSNESFGSYLVSSASSIAYKGVDEIFRSNEVMNWVAFGPNGAYVVDTTKTAHISSSSMARKYAGKSLQFSLRCASFGFNGSWVLIEDDGKICSHGLSKKITTALKANPVRMVSLSPATDGAFFIEYTDGTTNFSLPLPLHVYIDKIERMPVLLDRPGPSTKQCVLFAFGPARNLFCIVKGTERTWAKVSQSLSSRLKKPGVISAVSMGECGAYFWKGGGESFVPPTTAMAYPEVWKLWKERVQINWVAFGPEGYYICDTPGKLHASRSSIILRTTRSGEQVPLRCASFGYGGSWVVVECDGVVRSHGLTAKVRTAMLQQEIRNIQLSLVNDAHYYIEYMDGTSNWSLPSRWHNAVRRIDSNLDLQIVIVSRPAVLGAALTKLDQTEHEYSSACYQFATSWRHPNTPRPNVQFVYKVQYDPDLHKRYQSYLSRVGNEQQLFHCTRRICQVGDPGENTALCNDTNCSLCRILRSSFSVQYARSTGMFGSGIYSSATSSKASLYSRNTVRSNYNAMLLVRVAVGKMYCTDVADRGREAPPAGYDSVCGLPGIQLNHDETVVYNDDAIRPAYLIVYEGGRPEGRRRRGAM